MALKRSDISKIADIKTEEVKVPEWDGSVLVRGLSGAERDAFESSIVQLDGKKTKTNLTNIRAKLVALTVVDEEGNVLFDQPGDIEMLGTKSAAALDRIFSVAQRLSGLTPEDVEELAKNSNGGRNAASISG